MRKGLTFALLLLLVILPGAVLAQDDTETTVPEPDQTWWNERVFYEIFVRSFADSNGDGVGDFQGIIERLDYLNDGDPTTDDDLGITGIWLMPISPSPTYHGYDVTDYRAVNSDYGTMEDFQRLLDEAHERGIKVIVDLVMNHSSVEHPWFVASAQGEEPYADWYIWEEEDPGYRGPDGQTVWHPRGDRYYYGLFWSGMPDLNYRNDAVTEEMHDIAGYWLDEVGVDGFRLDAVKHMIEDGRIQENTDETRAWLRDFKQYVDGVAADALLVGEVWSSRDITASYVGPSLDLVFEFDYALSILRSAGFGIAGPVENAVMDIQAAYPQGQYATFITNHDQNRVMSQLNGEMPAAKAAASILLTGPGVPFVYYGEEIGMTGTKPDPEIRTPMQWGDGRAPGGGFTVARPWAPLNADWQEGVTVADQTDDPDSLLSRYRDLIHLRNETPALQYGTVIPVASEESNVYSFLRQTDDGETVLVVINLKGEAQTDYGLTLDASDLEAGSTATPLYGADSVQAPELNADGGFSGYQPLETLPPSAVLVVTFR